MLKKFTIFGERCSGTNFLRISMTTNFELDITWEFGWKHFFGFKDLEKMNTDDTLFIGLIREPVSWLNSFYKNQHHIPKCNSELMPLLFNTFYSEWDDGSLVLEDLNYKTKEKYANIFELRKMKNDFLINTMPKLVKNYVLLRYEDLNDNTVGTFQMIMDKYNLKMKMDHIEKLNFYKIFPDQPYVPKPVDFPEHIIKMIENCVDKEQEQFSSTFWKNGEAIEVIKKTT